MSRPASGADAPDSNCYGYDGGMQDNISNGLETHLDEKKFSSGSA